jgi:hypothetical protein
MANQYAAKELNVSSDGRKVISMTLEKSKVKKVLSYRWAVFGVLAFAYFFVYFHRVSSAVVSTDLQTTFKVSTAASIALLSSVYFYAYTVMQLPSGLLTDNWGPRKTVSLFTLVAAAGAILTGIASTFETVIRSSLEHGCSHQVHMSQRCRDSHHRSSQVHERSLQDRMSRRCRDSRHRSSQVHGCSHQVHMSQRCRDSRHRSSQVHEHNH